MSNVKNDAAKTREVEEMIRRARHPAERALSIISGILTVGIFAFLLWLVIYAIRKPADESVVVSFLASFLAIEESSAGDLLKMGAWAVLAVFLWILIKYVAALMNEKGRAEDEDFTIEEIKPEKVKKVAEQYAEILGMEEMPEVFFSEKSKGIDIEGIQVYGEDYVVIPMYNMYNVPYDERMVDVRFKLATKLGNIRMGYNGLLFQILTFAGRILPVFKGLYIKSLVYGSDRMALEILKRDPEVQVTGEEIALSLFIGESIYKSTTLKVVDVDKTLRDRRERFHSEGRLSQAMSRLGEDKPLLMDRIEAMEDLSKPGKLI